LLFTNIFNLQYFFLTGYDSWTWAEPNGVLCRNTRAEWRLPKRGVIVRRQPRSTLCGMFVKPFSCVSYYFFELNLMILVFISRRHIIAGWERYGNDPSTHLDFNLDLWMEVGSSGGPDRNQVFGLSNTTTENLRATRGVSTVWSSQLVSSTQS
jgi:hypothetical protein